MAPACGVVMLVILLAIGGVPSYVIAGRGAMWWKRVAAVLAVPVFLLLIANGFPKYPPGRNRDDFRRGSFMALTALTAIASAGVQAAMVIADAMARCASNPRKPLR